MAFRAVRMLAWGCLVLVAGGTSGHARDAAKPVLDTLPEIARGTVASVADGTTLTLADGRVLRLDGLLAPAPPLGLPQATPWPVADAARTALADLVTGHEVGLHAAAAAADRHGRMVGQLFGADGTWLQRRLVADGSDRVEPTAAVATLAPALLKAEADARRRHRGLWRLAAYAVRAPDRLTARDTGTYVLVEGKVLAVAPAHDATYLDFAEDWHHGFTVRIPRAVLQRDPDFDPQGFQGRKVRVRGWLAYEGRPILDLADPAALEPLGRARKPAKPPVNRP